jgi:hypothetical protein
MSKTYKYYLCGVVCCIGDCPLFRKQCLNRMTTILAECAEILADELQPKSPKGQVANM